MTTAPVSWAVAVRSNVLVTHLTSAVGIITVMGSVVLDSAPTVRLTGCCAPHSRLLVLVSVWVREKVIGAVLRLARVSVWIWRA